MGEHWFNLRNMLTKKILISQVKKALNSENRNPNDTIREDSLVREPYRHHAMHGNLGKYVRK